MRFHFASATARLSRRVSTQSMPSRITFDQIKATVEPKPGIYEIHTNGGIPLKVGIGGDIQCRLLDHGASRQSGLRLKAGGNRNSPSDVESKKSILAKHLYYDTAIAPKYDLTTESGRRTFLQEQCYIVFEIVETVERAKELEVVREGSGHFRYVGQVACR
jgi:hypothetical protein